MSGLHVTARFAFRRVPTGTLFAEPAAVAMLDLDDAGGAVLLAGPRADRPGDVTLALLRRSDIDPVPLRSDPATPGGRPDLVRLGPDLALVLVPGWPLLLVDPRRGTCEVADQIPRPDRLFALPGGPVGVTMAADGATRITPLDPGPVTVGSGAPRSGPQLLAGQRPGLLLADAAGALVFAADDSRRGVHLWREEGPDRWHLVSGDGAARYGFNGTVRDALPWGGDLLLAMGADARSGAALLGLPLRDELLLLRPDGRLILLSGESRATPHGLMIPHLPVAAVAALGEGAITHLGPAGGDAIVVTQPARSGSGPGCRVWAISPDATVREIATDTAPLRALRRGATGTTGLLATVF